MAVPAIVAAIEACRLVVEAVDGTRVLLDRTDVLVLDAVGETTPVPAVVDALARDGIEPEDARRRIARLVDAGVLFGHGSATDLPGETPDPPSMGLPGSFLGVQSPPVGPAVEDGSDPVVPDGLERASSAADRRIPVYGIWHPNTGPLLALGLLTSYARHVDDGVLEQIFEIRRPETAASFLEDLSRREGPAILLCSDYVWSKDLNLRAAREGLAINPALVVIHGGPSCPKYPLEAAQFLDENGEVAHVLVRGEGELVLAAVLEVLADSLPGSIDHDRLAQIGGLTFRSPTGEVIRTPDQGRIVELDSLPSPYLTGEFDDIPAEEWNQILAIETNRGCPYGCTFCDWGSSTLSRIRKFDLDRVVAEIEWSANHGVAAIDITDANFGILSRDVEIARRLADVKRRTGFPKVIAFYPAKNTTRHLIPIMDLILDAGISSAGSLSLQTIDPTTLENLNRSNIPTENFVAMAANFRRRGHPLIGDLLLGMPGQTVETYRRDLQFMFDHEIMTRTWPLQLLPNSPMNDPDYRAEHGIVSDDRNLIMSTASFDEEDRTRMLRMRRVDLVCERYGVLRHLLRLLQWDHGIEATSVMSSILDLVDEDPTRYPLIAWVMEHFDLWPTVPVGWRSFYEEVRRFVVAELGVEVDAAFEAVLQLQWMLMPAFGRELPATITLAHDYVAYYRDATETLFTTGAASGPERSLATYPPATFTVTGDPLRLCDYGMLLGGDTRSETMQGEFYAGTTVAYELMSPLIRLLPWVGGQGIVPDYLGPEPASVDIDNIDRFDESIPSIPVGIRT